MPVFKQILLQLCEKFCPPCPFNNNRCLLLSSLHNVRANLIAIAQIPQPEGQQQQSQPQQRHSGRRSGGQTSLLVWPPGGSPLPETVQQCGQETLEELDWCLEQLETIQVYRSVTEMASSKFRKLLNRELTHFAESSKSGPQISRFLLNTYMEQEEAQEEVRLNFFKIKSSFFLK
ncbi:unnamed protein product [Meloidogyne enterolobii]|uniref:Uncharacterized protein n=1 Tax=Meloidogyne enterolobii TaxID=390850 RepID=A0ACB0ZUN5_MELEN